MMMMIINDNNNDNNSNLYLSMIVKLRACGVIKITFGNDQKYESTQTFLLEHFMTC